MFDPLTVFAVPLSKFGGAFIQLPLKISDDLLRIG